MNNIVGGSERGEKLRTGPENVTTRKTPKAIHQQDKGWTFHAQDENVYLYKERENLSEKVKLVLYTTSPLDSSPIGPPDGQFCGATPLS